MAPRKPPEASPLDRLLQRVLTAALLGLAASLVGVAVTLVL